MPLLCVPILRCHGRVYGATSCSDSRATFPFPCPCVSFQTVKLDVKHRGGFIFVSFDSHMLSKHNLRLFLLGRSLSFSLNPLAANGTQYLPHTQPARATRSCRASLPLRSRRVGNERQQSGPWGSRLERRRAGHAPRSHRLGRFLAGLAEPSRPFIRDAKASRCLREETREKTMLQTGWCRSAANEIATGASARGPGGVGSWGGMPGRDDFGSGADRVQQD